MLFVLEGVDGSGKTTLAYEIAEALRPESVEIIHFGPPTQHPLEEYEHTLDSYQPSSGHHIICDRLHWGEMIYADLYRAGSQLGPWGFWHVERYLESRGALMVHVTADLDVIRERLIEKGETFLQPEDIAHVRTEFERYANESTLHPVWLDTGKSLRVTADTLVTIARFREMSVAPISDYTSYVGGLEPDLLLVGEEPNTQQEDHKNLNAAFPPFPWGAGRYLIENVITPLERRQAAKIGLVNAYQHGHVAVNLRGLYDALDKPRTVALGRYAEHLCRSLGVPHSSVPHPQFWRRFHYKEPDEYRKMIMGE